MSQPNMVDTVVDKVKSYINIRTELFTLKIVQHLANATSRVLWIFLVSSCWIMTILLSSIGLALFLSNSNANWHQGFFYVSLLYLFISVILLLVNKKLTSYINNKVIDNILNDDDDDDDND